MITGYQTTRYGLTTTVTVASDLVAPAGGTVFYHWYRDGSYIGMTTVPTRSFVVEAGEQLRILVKDTLDAAYDGLGAAPAGYPARRTLTWIRSLGDDVAKYQITQAQRLGGEYGDPVALATVHHETSVWDYDLLSSRLDDLYEHLWQAIPVDAAGNEGVALEIGEEKIVRTPDAPDFTVSFDEGTRKVTFAAA